MSPAAIAALSADILGLCQLAGLTVHSVDCDEAGVFTVCCNWTPELLDSLFAAQRQRMSNYHISYGSSAELWTERLEFRVSGKGGGG